MTSATEAMPILANPAPDVRTREKLEGGKQFVLSTEFEPAGDQPTAIKELAGGILDGERSQVLLGATGTGKTFTMAKVIEETQRPAIILAPNKTLAAQLYGEFKGFFPDNAVELNIGHSIMGRAVFDGLNRAVADMKSVMETARNNK